MQWHFETPATRKQTGNIGSTSTSESDSDLRRSSRLPGLWALTQIIAHFSLLQPGNDTMTVVTASCSVIVVVVVVVVATVLLLLQ